MKKTRTQKLHTNNFADAWAKTQHDLGQAAQEQTAADLDLVIATRGLVNAQNAHHAAISRKTKAEARLSKLRADLGVEV